MRAATFATGFFRRGARFGLSNVPVQLRAPQPNPNRTLEALVDLLDTGDLRRLLRAQERLARAARTVPQLRRVLLESLDEAVLAPLALAALARRVRFF